LPSTTIISSSITYAFDLSSNCYIYLFLVDFLPKKILVLDLDETLIHSHHDGLSRVVTVKPTGPPDFIVRVEIERHPVRFFVYKRPHVDYFLETVTR
jgi:CTD nuclear envelope phosphatase 1